LRIGIWLGKMRLVEYFVEKGGYFLGIGQDSVENGSGPGWGWLRILLRMVKD
jgi:hypothetical protein